ncbi:alkaline shock response membrane anchor protein AmaP [Nocardia sp. BMG51109]|uniref:alkaline shock response membrane anchor protein AmaP n=1 Tax=Nocardia sp. BMG51109 TaxID=1056816 RepID=UPI0004BAA6F5|nr:alkaline shock response membrane anchor protein AmaP [Nocardia sp. BMG51109]
MTAGEFALIAETENRSEDGDPQRPVSTVDGRYDRPSIRRRPPAGVNRTVLGLVGVLVLALGGLALAAHFGRVSWLNPSSPVLPHRNQPPAWQLWAIVVAAGAVGLACLRWATAQLTRMPPAVRWRARTPDSADRTELDAATVAGPVEADLRGYDGVRSAAARLSGPGRNPQLHLVVIADPDTDLVALRDRIREHAVPRLCQALEVDTIPVTMEVRLAER